MRPATGFSKPMASLSNVVLPEPLGPNSTVGGPAATARLTALRIGVAPAANATSWNAIGKLLERSRMGLASLSFGPAAGGPGQRIDGQDHHDQHQPEADRERQVAFGGLERNGGCHHAGKTIDVAAHDHHRADLGRGPAE